MVSIFRRCFTKIRKERWLWIRSYPLIIPFPAPAPCSLFSTLQTPVLLSLGLLCVHLSQVLPRCPVTLTTEQTHYHLYSFRPDTGTPTCGACIVCTRWWWWWWWGIDGLVGEGRKEGAKCDGLYRKLNSVLIHHLRPRHQSDASLCIGICFSPAEE